MIIHWVHFFNLNHFNIVFAVYLNSTRLGTICQISLYLRVAGLVGRHCFGCAEWRLCWTFLRVTKRAIIHFI